MGTAGEERSIAAQRERLAIAAGEFSWLVKPQWWWRRRLGRSPQVKGRREHG